jgi:hypothetical protein
MFLCKLLNRLKICRLFCYFEDMKILTYMQGSNQMQVTQTSCIRHSSYTEGNLHFTHVIYNKFLENRLLLCVKVVIFNNTYLQSVFRRKCLKKYPFSSISSYFYLNPIQAGLCKLVESPVLFTLQR